MTKLLLPVLVGVFVSAFTIELVRRNNPELVEGMERKARSFVRSVEERLAKARRQLAR